jgi:sarcosine oxidase/L-pipecolate oxidase
MKLAIHSNGYQNPAPPKTTSAPVSFPSFASGERANAQSDSSFSASSRSEQYIPADKLKEMMTRLAAIYPDLANAPVKYTRVCFYSDSEDENWIIDHYPGLEGLVVASGDSGHAFKFLPVLGSLVCGRLGIPTVASLTPHQDNVFSFAYHQQMLSPQTSNSALANTSLVPTKLRFRL